MLVALIIILSVVAAGLLVLYLQSRRSAAEFRVQADRREDALRVEREELTTERDELTEAKTAVERELTTARSENTRLTGANNASAAEVRRLGGELDKARAVGDEQAERLTRQSAEIDSLVAGRKTLQDRLDAAELAAAAAATRDRGIEIKDGLDLGRAQPETLWNLELVRSERTWRTSVAANPAADVNPFDEADDPVRLAVEIEAAALRENVGASITIDWQADAVASPAHGHLVVRVAQELLEAAARSPEPSRLVATGDAEAVTLSLEAEDTSDEVINIIPLRISSDLIELRDETGSSLTVTVE